MRVMLREPPAAPARRDSPPSWVSEWSAGRSSAPREPLRDL
jgi:hypothetical protein